MVDMQSGTAEIRRGKRKKIEKETTGQKYNGLPYSIPRPSRKKERTKKPQDENIMACPIT